MGCACARGRWKAVSACGLSAGARGAPVNKLVGLCDEDGCGVVGGVRRMEMDQSRAAVCEAGTVVRPHPRHAACGGTATPPPAVRPDAPWRRRWRTKHVMLIPLPWRVRFPSL